MTTIAAAAGFDFITFFWMMVIASIVAGMARYIRVPYALALVITGLIVAPTNILPQVHLEPHILFTIFLPPLLFESAINMRVGMLRMNWLPISIYALGGTLLSTFVVGGLAAWILDLPLVIGLVFGALISPTDPISVIAIFKQLGVGKRLSTIMEAESLFNDGIAIVLFTLLVDAAMGEKISLLYGIQSFIMVVAGGAIIGVVIGAVASRITREFDDHLFEIMLTTIVAFGSFLSAESLHVSGVIAVVAAGLVMGSYGMQTGMSATTRLSVTSFWEYAAFAVNSIVFLLVGFEVTFVHISAEIPLILLAVLVVLAGRAVAIYGLSPLINTLHGKLPLSWQHVLFWGGLRGAIPMALVLGLGRSFPERNQLVLLTFGVVLFSLLVQGLSIKTLLQRLGLGKKRSVKSEYGRLASGILAAEAAREELEKLRNRKALSDQVYEILAVEYSQRLDEMGKEIEALRSSGPDLLQIQEKEARIQTLLAEKSSFKEAERNGLLEEEDLQQLVSGIDRDLESLKSQD
ncbi:MAG: Na+/H+ antiporter [Syntrophomonadaceae bacterium]|nr:Na+/H+ antiporter [Syntrophomonadaceae bacterium]MDD3022628.1 Na+/H+ antiporter [Syntrophomonadaceae bacterium]